MSERETERSEGERESCCPGEGGVRRSEEEAEEEDAVTALELIVQSLVVFLLSFLFYFCVFWVPSSAGLLP